MIIYKINNNINDKIYIGQTVGSLSNRKSGHIADSKRDRKDRVKSKISKAISKYGIDNFTFEILKETNSIDELNFLEQKYIAELKSNTDKVGYNLLSGGHQNGKHSKETKIKMSLRSVLTASKVKGHHWNKGRIPTLEQRKRVSEKLIGVPCPERGRWGNKNPMKNHATVVKMLITRKANRLKNKIT